MKHASDYTLDQLESLLVEIRKLPTLTERKRGVFYRKAEAALHFHEDPSGIYADLRKGTEWERYRTTSNAERARFLRRLRGAVHQGSEGHR